MCSVCVTQGNDGSSVVATTNIGAFFFLFQILFLCWLFEDFEKAPSMVCNPFNKCVLEKESKNVKFE